MSQHSHKGSKKINSGASNRRVRRWSFHVKVTTSKGLGQFVPPTMTLGTREVADRAALEIKENLSTLPQFAAAYIEVTPLQQEFIHPKVVAQINGLNDEAQITGLALFKAISTSTPVVEGESDEQREERIKTQVGTFVTAARQELLRQRAGVSGIEGAEVITGDEAFDMIQTAEAQAAGSPAEV